jgi:hypothetical protein
MLIKIILALLAGISMGYAIGIGLLPLYNQPKNFKRQIAVSFMGIGFLFLLILLIFV